MAITTSTTDLEIIAALDDEPNDVGGLSAAELKATFDESGLALQEYINTVLIPELDAEHLPYVYGSATTIKETIEGVVAGVMPDESVTLTTLSPAVYASEAQAEAGTENTTLMTPLRVAQAITALFPYKIGSYVGTGTYGSGNPNTLTFTFTPKFMIILVTGGVSSEDAGVENPVFINPSTSYSGMKFNPGQNVGENVSTGSVSWGSDSITWYSASGASRQCNTSGYTYYYLAIG